MRPTTVLSLFASLTIAPCVAAQVATGPVPVRWSQFRSVPGWSPAARAGFAFASDGRGEALLFGGHQTLPPPNDRLADTWRWRGGQWLRVATMGPSPREYTAMAYDPVRDRYVLFGGATGVSLNAEDTWEWTGSGWVDVTPSVSPGQPAGPQSRFSHSMAFDPVRQTVLMWGGWTGAAELDELWEWDGTQWSEIPRGAVWPPASTGVSMATDPVRQRVVWFGDWGSCGSSVDTWEWDGARFHQVSPPVSPPARNNAPATYSAALGGIVLSHGWCFTGGTEFDDSWLWDGQVWRSLQHPAVQGPSPRGAGGLFEDPGRGSLVMFGGSTIPLPRIESDQTWELVPVGSAFYSASTGRSGCPSSVGVPTLSHGSLPVLGGSLALQVSGLAPASPGFLYTGLFDDRSGALPLPYDLALFGAPGCKIHLDPDPFAGGTPELVFADAVGLVTANLAIPNHAALTGLRVFNQLVSFDNGLTSRLQVAVSNQGLGILGR